MPATYSVRTVRTVSPNGRTVGPKMLKALTYVREHPGCRPLHAARAVGSQGHKGTGYDIVHRAVRAALFAWEASDPRILGLPREALLEAGKTKGATKEPNSRLVVNGTPGTVTLHRDGRQLTVTDPSLPALDAGDYPDWEAILERLSPTVIKIGLNVAYLADLAAAMRSDRIMLSLDASEPGTKPIRVDPLEASEPPVTADGRKPFGVLMPVTVSS